MRFFTALVLAPLLPTAIYVSLFSGSPLLAAIWFPQILLSMETALLLLIALPDRVVHFHTKVGLAGVVLIGACLGALFCAPFIAAFAQPKCVGVYVVADYVGCLSRPHWRALAKAVSIPVFLGTLGGAAYWVLARIIGVYRPRALP